MKLEVETRNFLIGSGLIFLCIIINLLGEYLFPYEIIKFGVDNEINYSLQRLFTSISAAPFILFFMWLGYLIGRKKYEKPVEKIS